VKKSERAEVVLEGLRKAIPQPETELHYEDEFRLLVAVMLSAQCTDARVNMVTPSLFEAFPDVAALADATPEMVYPLIKSISYPNNKSNHLVGMARKVRDVFDGKIPESIDALRTLPGVGRKTAQVVASVAFESEEALPVDTHVFRVANRLGLTNDAATPLKVEQQLKALYPPAMWGEVHHLLILHGRYRCTARSPRCDECTVSMACEYFAQLQKLPRMLSGMDVSRGRYYCKTRGHYFDEPIYRTDRQRVEQVACPKCQSMNVFETKTGRTTKRIKDYRI